ncbi:unnamed protein product [Darwinula stevensoni]|uniref:Uncharacterized protein n=1 Tax=Darwinula stevensoni TaxID=69355 RepID=A0A7R8X417_9CRUS|nr:unnamed protein product [Darwinula stevensoni]CAG0879197.1 unnamed protein product [Darwinula stevensoni]
MIFETLQEGSWCLGVFPVFLLSEPVRKMFLGKFFEVVELREHEFPSLNENELFMAQYALLAVLGFLSVSYVWKTYLHLRQRRSLRRADAVPVELQGVINQEKFDESRDFEISMCNFHLLKEFFHHLLVILILVFGGLPFVWKLSHSIFSCLSTKAGWKLKTGKLGEEIILSVLCMFLLSWFNALLSFPFAIYEAFVIRARHGVKKQTWWQFIKEHKKSFWVAQLFILPITAGSVWFLGSQGESAFHNLWVVSAITTLFLTTIFPTCMALYCSKTIPLGEGSLRTAIEDFASSVGFPLKSISVLHSSCKQDKNKVFTYGVWRRKHLVLSEALVEVTVTKRTVEESFPTANNTVNQVSKAEGDDKDENERPKENDEKEEKEKKKELKVQEILEAKTVRTPFTESEVVALVSLFMVSVLIGYLYSQPVICHAFGFPFDHPILMRLLVILVFVLVPYREIMGFLCTWSRRRFEFQADAFCKAQTKAESLKAALLKLNCDDLSFTVDDWLFSAWHHCQPRLLQRLQALQKTE